MVLDLFAKPNRYSDTITDGIYITNDAKNFFGLLFQNFCTKDTIFCGVFDGHGPSGHRVAKRVRDSFPLKLIAQWELHHNNKDGLSDNRNPMANHKSEDIGLRMVGEKSSLTVQEHNCTNTMKALKESLLKACKIMDKELKLHPDIDCFCSGTTAVALVKQVRGLNLLGNNFFNHSLLFFHFSVPCVLTGARSCYWKCWGFKSYIGY